MKTIPLSRLKTELEQTLNECAHSGETVVVQMPDHRLLAIQALEPDADDALVDELLASNPQFTPSPRNPKPVGGSRFPWSDHNERLLVRRGAGV